MNTCKRWMFCDPQKHSKKSTGSSDPSTSLAPHSYICLFVSCFCLFVCWWSTFTKSFRWMFTWSTKIFQQICTESKVLASSYKPAIFAFVCLLIAFVYLLMINMYSWMFSRFTTAFQQIYTESNDLISIDIPQSVSSIMSPMSMPPFNFFVKRKETFFFLSCFLLSFLLKER